ncbi:MAG TPA: QsdR family transcriptional regulator, partial [Mycobacterium sp.]|nr:QsdR family transcriptional regulator [Mycobacterium sp.]
RATLYRWVGNRDLLLAEVLWSLAELGFAQLKRDAKGKGVDWFMDVYRGFGDLIVDHKPIRTWVENEPECALRVMASKHTPHQQRVVSAFKDALEEAQRAHGLKLKLDADTLAFVLVRLGESYLWAELMTGQARDRDEAHAVARALLS